MLSATIPPTVSATVYVRWSSEAQTGRDSLRRQLEAARRHAEESRLLIVETIIDEAVSAFSGHHLTKGGLGAFIRRVEAGDLKLPHVLIVESLDRLNRQAPLDALAPFIALINAGITLVTLTDGHRFTRQSMAEDGGLRLLSGLIVMLRAHEESATKSKRVSAAWARKRAEADTHKLTKVCPAWLSLSDDRTQFLVLEDRANIVRRVFEETASGVGKASVASRLNADGVPPFRGGDGWHASYIQKLIGSDAVIGLYQPHLLKDGKRLPAGPRIEDYFPPIIDRNLLLKARAAVISRRQSGAGRKAKGFRNILNGVAQCGACGSRMTYVSKGDAERYLACSAARRRRACMERTLFNFDEAERGFLSSVATFSADRKPSDGVRAAQTALRQATSRTEHLSKRLDGLLEAFGSDHTEEIVRTIAKVRDDLALARAEQRRMADVAVLLEHGAGLVDLRRAIANLTGLSHDTPEATLLLVRAQVAHSAKGAGFTVTFYTDRRIGEVTQRGSQQSVRFNCAPTRPVPKRDALGMFAAG